MIVERIHLGETQNNVGPIQSLLDRREANGYELRHAYVTKTYHYFYFQKVAS